MATDERRHARREQVVIRNEIECALLVVSIARVKETMSRAEIRLAALGSFTRLDGSVQRSTAHRSVQIPKEKTLCVCCRKLSCVYGNVSNK